MLLVISYYSFWFSQKKRFTLQAICNTYIPGFTATMALVSFTSFSLLLTIAVSVLTAILGHIVSHSVFLYHTDVSAGIILKIELIRDFFCNFKAVHVEKISADLMEEIDSFIKESDKMKDVVLHPSKYNNGRALRAMYIKKTKNLEHI